MLAIFTASSCHEPFNLKSPFRFEGDMLVIFTDSSILVQDIWVACLKIEIFSFILNLHFQILKPQHKRHGGNWLKGECGDVPVTAPGCGFLFVKHIK